MPYLTAFLILMCLVLTFALVKTKYESKHQYTLRDLMYAQTEGERQGLLEAAQLIHRLTLPYGQSSLTLSLQEKLKEEATAKTLRLKPKRLVEKGIRIPIKTE
jgi:hypothetical protein